MDARPQRRLDGGRYYLVLAIGLLIALAMFGGASRPDELQQFFVRGCAILAIAAALWPLNFSAFRDGRLATAGFALILILLLVQLIPLPPTLWAGMPGHELYAMVAKDTGETGWRPWTVSPDLTLNSIAALLPPAAIGLIALALDIRGRLVLARVLVGIACASALLGLMQFAGGGSALHLFRTTSQDSAVGLFANRNHQAALMACALPIGAALASIHVHREGTSARYLGLLAAGALLLLMGLAATGSRMGLLLGAVGIAASVLIFLLPGKMTSMIRQANSRVWIRVVSASLVILLSVSAVLWRGGAVSRLASDPVDQTRAAALKPMLAAVRAFFPFGAGFGTFDPVYRRFEPDSLLSTIYLNQAHNEPIQLAIEGGVFAIVLLLLFLAWWTQAAIRSVRPRESSSRRAMSIAMTAVTLILMLSSLVDYPLRTPLLSGLFAIACVELLRSSHPTERTSRM